MSKVFDFGENWLSYSKNALSPARVDASRKAFKKLIGDIPIKGKRFLDVGFGQGLSSLCAVELGAVVYGIDINKKNIEALELTKEVFRLPDQTSLSLQVGSILSAKDIERLRNTELSGFDIVHSWGALHHTGNMAEAFKNCRKLLKSKGVLIVAIYNRHWSSPIWRQIKKFYCWAPKPLQRVMIAFFTPVIFFAKLIVTRENPLKSQRGMDFLIDIIDWVGGYPYEYASVTEMKALGERHGLKLIRTERAQVPTGCNEFIFVDRFDGYQN